MGQSEILEFLQEQKKLNPDKWFEAKEVKEHFKNTGMGERSIKQIPNNLYRLSLFKLIKIKREGTIWKNRIIFHA